MTSYFGETLALTVAISWTITALFAEIIPFASTLMALTPILIIWPAHLIFGQKITVKEVVGAVISMAGISLFFL